MTGKLTVGDDRPVEMYWGDDRLVRVFFGDKLIWFPGSLFAASFSVNAAANPNRLSASINTQSAFDHRVGIDGQVRIDASFTTRTQGAGNIAVNAVNFPYRLLSGAQYRIAEFSSEFTNEFSGTKISRNTIEITAALALQVGISGQSGLSISSNINLNPSGFTNEFSFEFE